MWRCASCGETVDDDGFLVCWNCGTSREGPDPGEEPPPLPTRSPPEPTVRVCPECATPLALRGPLPIWIDDLGLEAWSCPGCRRVLLYEIE